MFAHCTGLSWSTQAGHGLLWSDQVGPVKARASSFRAEFVFEVHAVAVCFAWVQMLNFLVLGGKVF